MSCSNAVNTNTSFIVYNVVASGNMGVNFRRQGLPRSCGHTLNFLSLAKGKDKIEVYRRQIADISVKRAFATISLSLVVIGLAIILISVSDEDKTLLSIAFECFSAYSTVGLSVGITADLSTMGKAVIISTMFIGRVSMLTILIAIFKQVKHKNYRYPTEEITIN